MLQKWGFGKKRPAHAGFSISPSNPQNLGRFAYTLCLTCMLPLLYINYYNLWRSLFPTWKIRQYTTKIPPLQPVFKNIY